MLIIGKCSQMHSDWAYNVLSWSLRQDHCQPDEQLFILGKHSSEQWFGVGVSWSCLASLRETKERKLEGQPEGAGYNRSICGSFVAHTHIHFY